jgi:hypothetical protein
LAGDLHRWVIDGPAAQGLDCAGWIHAEMADHLLKAKGIRAEWVRRIRVGRHAVARAYGGRNGPAGQVAAAVGQLHGVGRAAGRAVEGDLAEPVQRGEESLQGGPDMLTVLASHCS